MVGLDARGVTGRTARCSFNLPTRVPTAAARWAWVSVGQKRSGHYERELYVVHNACAACLPLWLPDAVRAEELYFGYSVGIVVMNLNHLHARRLLSRKE